MLQARCNNKGLRVIAYGLADVSTARNELLHNAEDSAMIFGVKNIGSIYWGDFGKNTMTP